MMDSDSKDRAMKIELKNVHYSPHSSQETACFTAAVWLDGKNAGTVRNAGQGGCHHYTPATLEASLAAHAATLTKVNINRTPIQPSADFIITEESIGNASSRESVCQYGWISGVA